MALHGRGPLLQFKGQPVKLYHGVLTYFVNSLENITEVLKKNWPKPSRFPTPAAYLCEHQTTRLITKQKHTFARTSFVIIADCNDHERDTSRMSQLWLNRFKLINWSLISTHTSRYADLVCSLSTACRRGFGPL